MHILMIRPTIEVGGASRTIGTLAKGLLQRGHQVSVATGRVEYDEVLEGLDARLLRLPLYPSGIRRLVSSAIGLSRYVRAEGVDIVHSHHRFAGVVGYAASLLTGVPLVATIHEFKEDYRLLSAAWRGRRSIVPSAALRQHLVSHYRIDPSRIVVIANSIDIEPPRHAARSQLRSRLGLAGAAVVVGFIGRLSWEKGGDVFVGSMPGVLSQARRVHFLVLGDGPERHSLEALAENLGVKDSITFLGQVRRAADYIPAMDIVVVPSREEGYSLVSLEAMAFGRPVVASRVGGIPEVVRDNVTGLLVDSPDPTHFSTAISMLVLDTQKAEEMGREGKRVFSETNHPEEMVEQYIRIYREL